MRNPQVMRLMLEELRRSGLAGCPRKQAPPLGLTPGIAVVFMVMFSIPVSTFGGAVTFSFSISNYWNRVYSPAPSTIPGVSDYQAKSVAIFNGSVVPLGGTNPPMDGTLFLGRSAFGHALSPVYPANFLLGQDNVPDPALGVNRAIAPIIEPASRAFYVTNAVNPTNEYRVIAAEPGFVSISWFAN